MTIRGDIDRNTLIESFARIKDDISRLNQEITYLKEENKKILEENLNLKASGQSRLPDGNLDRELISQIVAETLKKIDRDTMSRPKSSLLIQFNKKRKGILKNRLFSLAGQKNLTMAEIKEIIVQQESLCSKATFYRYVEKMKKKGLIDFIKIDDIEVMIKLD